MKKFLTALTLTALTSTVANAAGYGVVDLERVVENSTYLGGVLKSMLTLNEAIIDVKEG